MFNILKLASAQHLKPNPYPFRLKRSKEFFLFDTKLFGNAGKCREACCRINSKSIRSVLESLICTQITVNLVCHGTLICNISGDNTGCQPYQIRNWAAVDQISEAAKVGIVFCWVIDKLVRNAFSGEGLEVSFKLNR